MDSRTWKLAGNATLRLPRTGKAMVVRVGRGTVLVTQEGDLEDHVLERGDELVLPCGGLAVVWAFTDAAISVGNAAPAQQSSVAAGEPLRGAA
jgi:hypothetical protein